MEKLDLIRKSGIVGAGGAGFPTWFKLSSKTQIVIANGAECEPLLHTDQYLMEKHGEEIIQGLLAVKEITCAQRAVMALKKKYLCFPILSDVCRKHGVEIFGLDDFYPAGDEQALTFEVTGKIVPEGGIPLQVGVTVDNVATLIQIFQSLNGNPVTERVITVAGEVRKPLTGIFPIGTPFSEIIALAGGITADDAVIIDGGPMMGRLADIDSSVRKTTSGILVFPVGHPVSINRRMDIARELRRDFAVCCNCTDCTRTCPRYQLGHNLEPHKIMQMLVHNQPQTLSSAFLCCECGACEFGCPMGLSPRNVNKQLKNEFREKNLKNPHCNKPEKVRSQRQIMKIPPSRLLKRFRLTEYYHRKPEEQNEIFMPGKVVIEINSHIGTPAVASVTEGQKVRKGDIIAVEAPESRLSSCYHASIDGTVREVKKFCITIVRG